MSFGRIVPEISKVLAKERLQILIQRAALKERISSEKFQKPESDGDPNTRSVRIDDSDRSECEPENVPVEAEGHDKFVERRCNRNSFLQREIQNPWKRKMENQEGAIFQQKKSKKTNLGSKDGQQDRKSRIKNEEVEQNREPQEYSVARSDSSTSVSLEDEQAERLHTEATQEGIALEEESAINPEKEPEEAFFKPLGGIGRVKKETASVVALPQWVKNAVTVPAKAEASVDLDEDADLLGNSMIRILRKNGINGLFPMQRQVMRELLDARDVLQEFPPRDLCVAAPTGSGKTLAYVVPLVKLLKGKFERVTRAVILLPTSELAKQVYDVFVQYGESFNISAGLLTGLKSHTDEIKTIIERGHSLVDLIIATPAKLLEHLRTTPEFNLSHVNYLVLDEADRMVDMILHGLITEVERAIYKGSSLGCQCEKIEVFGRFRLTSISCCIVDAHKLPLRKLLYSATLMADPEKLQCLNLFYPRVFQAKANIEVNNTLFVKKFALPASLEEFKVYCKINIRPLLVWWLSVHKNMTRMIVFTRTREECHRLCIVLEHMGNCRVADLSSNLKKRQRQNTLTDFDNGLFDVLVCTGVLARGIDLRSVQHVVLYHLPISAEEYVHMVGRTARANKTGTSLVLLDRAEDPKLSRTLTAISKSTPKSFDFNEDILNEFHGQYQKALALAKRAVLESSAIVT